jgi:hypothetical protein
LKEWVEICMAISRKMTVTKVTRAAYISGNQAAEFYAYRLFV